VRLTRGRRVAIVVGAAVVVATAVGLVVRRLEERARFVVYPEAEIAAVSNPHEYRGQPLCQACHPDRDERLADDPVKLCTSCHDFDHSRSHPVDVVQKDAESVALPLGEGGRILCHTCHPHHELGPIKDGLRLPFSELCQQCHRGH